MTPRAKIAGFWMSVPQLQAALAVLEREYAASMKLTGRAFHPTNGGLRVLRDALAETLARHGRDEGGGAA